MTGNAGAVGKRRAMTAALVGAFLLVGAALPAAVARAGQPGTVAEATPWLAGALQLPNGALETEKARGFTPGSGVQMPAPQPQCSSPKCSSGTSSAHRDRKYSEMLPLPCKSAGLHNEIDVVADG